MAGNKVVLEFAGDASKLAREAKKANDATDKFAAGAKNASSDLEAANKSTDEYVSKMSKVGNAVSGASDAIGNVSDAVQAFADIQNASNAKMMKHERALQGVKQAQEDYNQALQDGKQAAADVGQAEIDREQANLDAKVALKEYNEAVKEHGKNSDEAAQAKLDLKQAGQDVEQAELDQEQATRDTEQATIDAKDAQLDLNEAQKNANPPDLQKAADDIAMYTPVLTGLISIMALVTLAQYAWNLAQMLSPTTWIILGILALIAIIVLIIVKFDWVKQQWNKIWGHIKDAAKAVGSWFKDTLWNKWIKGAFNAIVDKGKDVWNWFKALPDKFKGAFRTIKDSIIGAFKSAFNYVADLWNSTIGRLSWTVPNWIPGIGGNSFSVPNIPRFHDGGIVPGAPGSETLALLQAGEKVTPANSVSHGEAVNVTVVLDGEVLMKSVGKAIKRSGGNAQIVLVGRSV